MPPKCRQKGRAEPIAATSSSEPEPQPVLLPPIEVPEEKVREALILLGLHTDLACEISVTAPSVGAALAAALDRLADDILVRHPGPEEAAGDPVGPSTSAWNKFQRRLKGTGLTRSQAAQLYREEQEALARRPSVSASGARASIPSARTPTEPPDQH